MAWKFQSDDKLGGDTKNKQDTAICLHINQVSKVCCSFILISHKNFYERPDSICFAFIVAGNAWWRVFWMFLGVQKCKTIWNMTFKEPHLLKQTKKYSPEEHGKMSCFCFLIPTFSTMQALLLPEWKILQGWAVVHIHSTPTQDAHSIPLRVFHLPATEASSGFFPWSRNPT